MKSLLTKTLFTSFFLFMASSTMQAVEKGPGWADTILGSIRADAIFNFINFGFTKTESYVTKKAKNWITNNPKTVGLLKNNIITIFLLTVVAVNFPVGEFFRIFANELIYMPRRDIEALCFSMAIIALYRALTYKGPEMRKLFGQVSKKLITT